MKKSKRYYGVSISRISHIVFVFILFTLGIVACDYNIVDYNIIIYPSEQQVENIAWQALNPYTTSHNRDAWEIIEIKKVVGSDIIDQFENQDYYGCNTAANLVSDSGVDPSKVYWFIHMEPRPTTPLPVPSKLWSPTNQGFLPEPNLYNALFLIDPVSGQVLVRRLGCAIP
jgi:hypothetical protein